MAFIRTKPDDTRHTHAVVFDPVTNLGTTSFDEEHFHSIVPDPAAPSAVILVEANGHSHELTFDPPELKIKFIDPPTDSAGGDPVDLDASGSAMSDNPDDAPDPNRAAEKIARVGALFSAAHEGERESLKDAEMDEKAHRGDTWPEDAKQDPDVDIITVNEIESKVDLLCGYLAQNKTDFKFFPPEAGDQKWAEMLDTLVKLDVVDAYNYHAEEASVFEDACITGRGWFNCRVDYSRHPKGNLVIEQFPWKAVRCGPHQHADLRDCEYLVKLKWMSLARLKVIYPDVDFTDVENRMVSFSAPGALQVNYELTDPYDLGPSNVSGSPSADAMDVMFSQADIEPKRRMVLVYELWEKEYTQEIELANVTTGERIRASDWPDDLLEQFATIPDVEVNQTDGTRMRVTVVAGGKLLADGFPDLPYQGFHVVPVYAKKRGKRFWSKIRAAYDLQLVINKRFVQAVDEVNRAASGWLVDDQCFTSKQQRTNFEQSVSRASFVADIKDLAHKPERVDPRVSLAALEGLIELSSGKMREVLGINPEMMGMSSRAESGIAIFQKQRQGLLGNVFLFESLSRAKQTLGRIAISYIQRLYNPDRILRLLSNAKNRRKLLAGTAADAGASAASSGGQPAADGQTANGGLPPNATDIFGLTREDIAEFLATFDAGKYDVIVGEAKENPTTRMTWFQIWNDYAMTHPDLPAEFLLALSDTPEKDRLFALLEEARAKAQEALLASRSASTASPPQRPGSPGTARPGNQPNAPIDALPAPPPTGGAPDLVQSSVPGITAPPEAGILTP